jgi:hypothetical protein
LVVATSVMHFSMLDCNLSIADASSHACLAVLFPISGRPCPVAGKGAVGSKAKSFPFPSDALTTAHLSHS